MSRLNELTQGSQALLQAISFLHPDSIPEYILEENPATSIWPGYPSTSAGYQNSRAQLIKRSLIILQKGKKTLTIQPLIQDAVRSRMTDDEFNKAFSSVLSFVSAVWPYEEFSFGNTISRWPRCQELFPHVLRFQSLFPRFKLPAILTQTHLNGPKIFIDTASVTNMWSRFDDTIPLLYLAELMLDAFGDGDYDDLILRGLNDQLAVLRRTLIYERGVHALHTINPEVALLNMKKFNEVVRDSYHDKPGGTDQTLAVSWNELGNAYLQNNDSTQAEECFSESKRVVQGRLGEAHKIFSQALTDQHWEYHQVSFVLGKLLLGCGNLSFAQGDLDESFDLHRQCLRQYKSTVGDNHHRTADACVKVASHYVRREAFESALALLNEAIEIYTASGYPYFIAELTRARRNRGMLYQHLGKPTEANADLDSARELWSTMCPDDTRKFADLEDEDFDKRIMFWSR